MLFSEALTDDLHSRPKNHQAMDNKGATFKQPSERNNVPMKTNILPSPSSQNFFTPFAVPLPPDQDDKDLMSESVRNERKPNHEQKLDKMYYKKQDKEAEHSLYKQFEKKIRPCIDLVDSLRSLGVEKHVALPAITVIGDQSSGKSSVLEALCGISLPRGNGIVTRCPLEVKMKRVPATQAWKGKICYRNTKRDLQNASEVEKAIREAQDLMAGTRGAISEELISLEIQSPDVPDLTLIDLPGIVRVAVGDQPEDIGEQIRMLLRKIIGCKETINLVVVPCNGDIATTEALKMAQEVDPSGERTLGVLTKPDLVDRGTEEYVLNITQNRVFPLKKGYMVVKCRGQEDISNKLPLATAILQERKFFEDHKHFSVLLREGKATIPVLAEKLTSELVTHIIKTLPTLESQIREMLQKTLQDLRRCSTGKPETESEKLAFLTDLIKLFNQNITQTIYGDELLLGKEIRLFSKIRRDFHMWGVTLLECTEKVKKTIPSNALEYEKQYRGREFPGFTNYRMFEDIIKEQILALEEPAVEIMNNVIGLVEEKFMKLTERHFADFHNLSRAVKARIEDIREKQGVDAERHIRTQFKMERIIYCQDDLYINNLKSIHEDKPTKAGSANALQFQSPAKQEPSFVQDIVIHTKAYMHGTSKRLSNQIPLIILSYALHDFGNNLQTAMLHLLQEKDKLDHLLQEDSEAARRRCILSQRVKCLTKACQHLRDFALM